MKKIFIMFITAFFCMMFSTNAFAEDYQVSEGGDSMETAQEISLNQMYAASLSYTQDLWFQFMTPAEKGFLDFYSKNINIVSNVRMEIVDAVSEVKQKNVCWIEQAESKNFALNASQTYYIRISMVSKAEKGNIKFSVTYTEDVVGDSKSNATDVNLNQKISGSIDGYDDVDYYRIYTGNGKNYTLTAQNINIGANLCVYLKNDLGETKGKLVESRTQFEQKDIELLPNTAYYIEIYLASNGKGQYIFSLLDNDPDATNPPVSGEPGIDDPDPVTPTTFPTEEPGIDDPDPVTPPAFPTEEPGIDDSDPVMPTAFPTEEPGIDDSDPVTPTDFPEQKQPQDFTTRYALSLTRQVGTILTQTVIGNETDVRYSSSNTRVATVSNMGRITCKAVGITLITVTAIESDEYEEATKTLTLTVMPKKVSVRSIKSTKKGQIIVTSGTTMADNDGYQIQYRNKGIIKRVGVKTSKTSVTKTLTGLKSGTKIRVRIRAYKRVGGKTIYGPYSSWKSTKVR